MILTILLIKSLLLAYLVTNFEPIQWIIEIIYEQNKDNKLIPYIVLPFTCGKCAAFWICLIMTHNIYLSIVASMIMIIFNKTLGKWMKEITF